jgi:hypothetical protein
MRAAMVLASAGYEPETLAFKRLLTECHSRAHAVVAAESGEYARQWLQGRAGKPAKVVEKFSGPEGLFDFLSQSAHADYRAVETWLAVSKPEGNTQLMTLPERRPEVMNATLTVCASESYDIAVLLARERGVSLGSVANVRAAIEDSFARFLPDRQSGSPD